jgi:hypothetical protein
VSPAVAAVLSRDAEILTFLRQIGLNLKDLSRRAMSSLMSISAIYFNVYFENGSDAYGTLSQASSYEETARLSGIDKLWSIGTRIFFTFFFPFFSFTILFYTSMLAEFLSRFMILRSNTAIL